nr:reverse transcriptase domain-containing protein [Tanacetum cinerariifolium]
LDLGEGDDRITFLIDKALRYSHSNDDTCFRMDVIDKVIEEEFDALLDDSKPFSTKSEKISESFLDHVIKKIPKQEEEVENSFEVLPLKGNQRIKNSIQEPSTDIVMKSLQSISNMLFWKKFFLELKHYFWDEPYLFQMCPDDMIRRCVYGAKTRKIPEECHHGPTRGHYGPSTTTKKVFYDGFYWPTIFKEAHTLVQNSDTCQRSGSLSQRDEMPQNNIQVSEIFNI